MIKKGDIMMLNDNNDTWGLSRSSKIIIILNPIYSLYYTKMFSFVDKRIKIFDRGYIERYYSRFGDQ